jgi:prevent-host-death family protein
LTERLEALIPWEYRKASARSALVSITANIAEAQIRLSELVAKVEAGEQVVIARDGTPVAGLAPLDEVARRRVVIEDIIARRDSGRIAPVSAEEILAWRDEGRRY